jgi:sugar phosphate isomerase/epimerase
MLSRRAVVAGLASLSRIKAVDADRLGVMCMLPADERGARSVLNAASQAGFQRIQVQFPWNGINDSFLKALPAWCRAAGLRVDVLSAYVNCVAPEIVIMTTRAEDFDRALEYAPEIGAKRLIAWTGGYGPGLMDADARNRLPEAQAAIRRFLEPRLKRLEAAGLTLALETYITLACPDARTLAGLLTGMPPSITAVLDPPNLTPVARYNERDAVMKEMFELLRGRIGVAHLKDFRLAKDGASYDLPGPLGGEVNYPLYLKLLEQLPVDVPLIAEHIGPTEFASTRAKLLPLLQRP